MASSSSDFPLIHSSSSSHLHAHPRIHGHTRQNPTDQTSNNDHRRDGEYHIHHQAQAPFEDEDESDPNGSGPGAPIPIKRTGPYQNKKLKSVPSANITTHGSESGNESYRVDYRKDREEWSDTAIACLLDTYIEKYNQLNRGNLRGRDWEEVAEAVSDRCGGGERTIRTFKSVEQCKNKIDNLKKRYKVEVQRISAGAGAGAAGGMLSGTSNWHWFKKIEAIIGNSSLAKAGSDEDRANSYTPRPSKRYFYLYLLFLR